jgi:hypothetical protein
MGVIEKGNEIYFPADKLTGAEVKFKWQQNLANKSA